ncbi:27228_t:CDS:2, partial [Dentiscutata erythropus]
KPTNTHENAEKLRKGCLKRKLFQTKLSTSIAMIYEEFSLLLQPHLNYLIIVTLKQLEVNNSLRGFAYSFGPVDLITWQTFPDNLGLELNFDEVIVD